MCHSFLQTRRSWKKRSIRESKLILLLDREQTSRQTDAVTKEGYDEGNQGNEETGGERGTAELNSD